jgi:hypothetical protein
MSEESLEVHAQTDIKLARSCGHNQGAKDIEMQIRM